MKRSGDYPLTWSEPEPSMASESNPNPRAEVVSFSKRAAGAARGGVLKRQFPGLRLAGGSAPVPATQKLTASPGPKRHPNKHPNKHPNTARTRPRTCWPDKELRLELFFVRNHATIGHRSVAINASEPRPLSALWQPNKSQRPSLIGWPKLRRDTSSLTLRVSVQWAAAGVFAG